MRADPLRLVVAALATFRLARLLALEEGPEGVLKSLRRAAGGEDIDPETGQPRTNLGRGATCPHCLGIWTAILLALLSVFPTFLGDFFLIIFGLAGAQSYMQGTSD